MPGTDRYTDALASLNAYRDSAEPLYHDNRLLLQAQVEATLALVAVVALSLQPDGEMRSRHVADWGRCITDPYLMTAPDDTAGSQP
jgi:hypothetical protein